MVGARARDRGAAARQRGQAATGEGVMAKRPKWLDRPLPEWMRNPEWMREIEHNAGKGISPRLVDRAFWLGDGDTSDIDPWVEALEAVDKRGDKGRRLRAP